MNEEEPILVDVAEAVDEKRSKGRKKFRNNLDDSEDEG